jgi:hypothetical protein
MKAQRAMVVVLGCAALLKLVGFAVSLNVAPALWTDPLLYASIARSRQLHGVGIPSIVWFSPSAVDHIPFYGPVYFDLVARSFDLLGPSFAALQIVSILGALAVAGGAALLAAGLSGDPRRWLWSAVVILWTPAIGYSSVSGTMATTAVGLELLALAVYVRGLTDPDRLPWHGAAAGVLLLAAALTTPRTYPFIVAFFIAGALLLLLDPPHARTIRLQLLAGFAVFVAGLLAWTVHAHGGPGRWLHYLAFVLTREDTDVAVLSTSVRDLAFNWTSAITPAAAGIAGAAATVAVWRRWRTAVARYPGVVFSLVTVWVAGLLIVWGMNLTFTLVLYFAIPLLAVVLALPRPFLVPWNGLIAAGVAAVLAAYVGATGVRWVRIVATWQARDPAGISEFVRAHVPPGSAVVGPNALYFFAVEQAGASYRSPFRRSPADWARWVPQFDPSAVRLSQTISVPAPAARFLMWQTGDDLPLGYECARQSLVGTFEPPANHLSALGPLGDSWDVGFPATTLYRLPPGCPTTFDPTGSRRLSE